MAATPIRLQKDSVNFSSVLSSAVLEWVLMLLLFLDGLFSYSVTRFARLCKLQTPCLICSRLDHILGNEKPGFYRDLICITHKSEISLSAYCHVHRKLADVRDMCEDCLLSFATEKKSNTETYRSLVGKLKVDIDDSDDAHPRSLAIVDGDHQYSSFYGDVAKVPLLTNDHVSPSPLEKHCSCCFKQFKNKSHAKRLLKRKSMGVDVDVAVAEASIPLSTLTEQHCLDLPNAFMMTDKPLVSTTIKHSGNLGFERLSHVGYSEVKITSDSESDVPFSDDEDRNTVVHGTGNFKEECMDRCLHPETATIAPNSLSTTLSDHQTLEKLIHLAPTSFEPSLLIPENQCHEAESHGIPTTASMIAIGHGLEEINWRQVVTRNNPSAPSEIISQQVPSEVPNMNSNISKIGDIACISNTLSGEVCRSLTSTETNMKTVQIMNSPAPYLQVPMDLNDAYKLATGSKSSLTSPTFTEIVARRDSSRVHEDLKLLISQISSSGGLESPWNDLIPSPRVNYQNDEFKFSDAVLQNITKRLSIERNESGLESFDGSIVSEIEGESAIDRLKRQVELDRKSMSLLYKELEEERNASAIAANQAMAMITRLQEEKAAMQMEALQYQRMMEDQAEYDQEALQKINDLLAQKEKEIQNLEVDVDSYRKRFRDDSMKDKKLESFSDTEVREYNPTSMLRDNSEYSTNSIPANMISLDARLSEAHLKVSLLDFEDEKRYISDCLKKLERKLTLFSNDGIYVDVSSVSAKDGFPVKTYEDFTRENYRQQNAMPEVNARRNGQYSEEADERNDLGSPNWEDLPQEKSQTGELMSERDSKVTNNGDWKENTLCFDSVDNRQNPVVSRENDLAAFAKEVLHLTERLEALEADLSFLEHTINSLRNGVDGIQFIQEIAYHLRELRKIGITHH